MFTTRVIRSLWDESARVVDHWLDRQFGCLRRQSTRGQIGILAISMLFPWTIMATASGEPGFSLSPVIEIAVLSALTATLAAVIPRLPRGSARRVVIGYFAFFINLVIAEFAYLYFQLGTSDPTGFTEPMTRFGAVYLAWSTFTTVGGSLDPLTEATRAAVMFQSILGFLLTAVGIGMALTTPSTYSDGEATDHQ